MNEESCCSVKDFGISLAEAMDIVRRISPPTPLIALPALGIWVKDERLLPTGSFKLRGASVWMAHADLRRPIVTASSGNHARALEWLRANTTEHPTLTVVVSDRVARAKLDFLAASGCDVVVVKGDNEARDAAARRLAARSGAAFCSSHDDECVIAGQATVAVEILDALPSTSRIFVPVGGGGLFAGTLVAARSLRADGLRVTGVEPEGANSMSRSLRQRRRVALHVIDTDCDALRASIPGNRCFELVQLYGGEVVEVTDASIYAAQELLEECIGPVELSAAAAVAGALQTGPAGRTVCVVTAAPPPSVEARVLGVEAGHGSSAQGS